MQLDRGYALLTLDETQWAPIGAAFRAWERFCETLSPHEKRASRLDAAADVVAGYGEAPGVLEQCFFTFLAAAAAGDCEATAGDPAPVRPSEGSAEGMACVSLRSAMSSYFAHMTALARHCVEAILEGLGVDVSQPAVRALLQDPSRCRSLPPRLPGFSADLKACRYYPAAETRGGAKTGAGDAGVAAAADATGGAGAGMPGTDEEVGAAQAGEAHVDIGLCSLIPLSSTPGLQVLDKRLRAWVEVERARCERGVLVLPCDAMRVLTGGFLAGTLHRVIRHPSQHRLSLPFMLRPPSDAPIATLCRAGTRFESPEAVNKWDCQSFPRFDPDFRRHSLTCVVPSARWFSYMPEMPQGFCSQEHPSTGESTVRTKTVVESTFSTSRAADCALTQHSCRAAAASRVYYPSDEALE